MRTGLETRWSSAVIALPVVPKTHIEESRYVEFESRTNDDHPLAWRHGVVLGIEVEPRRQRDVPNHSKSERRTGDLPVLQLGTIIDIDLRRPAGIGAIGGILAIRLEVIDVEEVGA